MYRFVPDHVGGLGSKRKNLTKSCDSCRKRHRRCSHVASTFIPYNGGEQPESTSAPTCDQDIEPMRTLPRDKQNDFSNQGTGLHTRVSPTSTDRGVTSNNAYIRFVGDLSPEASFLSTRRREGADVPSGTSRHAEVGVWLGQKPQTASTDKHGSSSKGQSPGLTALQAVTSQLRAECLSLIPPPSDIDALKSIYYAKVDPIFPVLHEEASDAQPPHEKAALTQCLCLVAASDYKARQHLRLPPNEHILSPIEFRGHLAAAVKQSLDMGFLQDKLVILQVCTLMAFYADQFNCSEVSIHYASQAVQHTQTLGLHLGWPDDDPQAKKAKRLFWCVWVVDRLNAATNGRPIMMHRQDIEATILASFVEQAPAFRLLIRVSQFLDTVIAQYRPRSADAETLPQPDNTTFEALVHETGASTVSNALLATIEVYYLAVVILQNRPREHVERQQPPPSSELQMFAATSIVAISLEDFKTSVTLLPIVPYAVSLAASVAYKTLRNSAMVYRRKRAYALFHGSCEILDNLSSVFASARAVAKLATDTMQEVERVAADRSKARRRHQIPESITRDTSSGTGPAAEGEEERIQGEALQEASSEETQGIGQTVQPAMVSSEALVDLPWNDSPSMINDCIGDAELFNNFDPRFDLDRIDQLFSANLDPTQPLCTQSWFADLDLES
ncbi:uncharacterized protein F5Z01DRAFT_522696 [Emericellopsis atlantica]|uniref:Xylanolytic transcriptional activator regulatory domain-containing protein n=1 Tax=Emericellopsis atlantica TaxID=2614577 RepID=A0A9P7ZQC4_9HYPO|nr:uncharacterized protein F5Z01DRAFT_522696 [Emericellopsis atlantica]KAG9255891.1 hypothetical protein F5Z01DRAFT_522696 [Emericellopsis atlantica]